MTNEPFDPAATEPVPPTFAQPTAPGTQVSGAPAPQFQPAALEPEPVPVAVTPTTRSTGGSSRVLNLALGVAVLVATAGVAFAAGRATAPATVANVGPLAGITDGSGGPGGFPRNGGYFPQGDPGTGGVPGGGAGRFGFGGGMSISGTVDSVTAESVTIKTASGQTITIGLDGSTAYHQQADATASDVQTGKTVIVQLSGGLRPGANGGDGSTGTITLGAASDVTVVP